MWPHVASSYKRESQCHVERNCVFVSLTCEIRAADVLLLCSAPAGGSFLLRGCWCGCRPAPVDGPRHESHPISFVPSAVLTHAVTQPEAASRRTKDTNWGREFFHDDESPRIQGKNLLLVNKWQKDFACSPVIHLLTRSQHIHLSDSEPPCKALTIRSS